MFLVDMLLVDVCEVVRFVLVSGCGWCAVRHSAITFSSWISFLNARALLRRASSCFSQKFGILSGPGLLQFCKLVCVCLFVFVRQSPHM